MITVKVVRQSSGKPAEGVEVSLSFGFGRGVTDRERTNSNGEAHFDADNGDGKVYVDGSQKHSGHLSGRVVVYI